MQLDSWGEMLGPEITLFYHTYYTLFALSYYIPTHQIDVFSHIEP